MRALTLDFRRGSYPRWVGVSLLLTGLAALIVVGGDYRYVQDSTRATQAALWAKGAVARKKVYRAVADGDERRMAQEFKYARAVAQQLDMPWDDLFRSVEAGGGPTVALLALESMGDRRRIQISAEAKNMNAMLHYVKELEKRPLLVNVYLLNHQVQLQDPYHPVRFVISATWRNRTEEEIR